ncbi:MAG TPA: mechanosensitive ion channel family protein [Acidimicrobiia bacterium]|jgi:small-conductance mechanosensitive channel
MIYAQETTTTTLAPPDPERPLTDFIVDLFDLEEGSLTAGLLGQIIEPILQILFIVVIAWLASRLLRSAVRRVTRRLKERGPAIEVRLGEGDTIVSTRKSQRLDALSTVISSAVSLIVWTIAVLMILGTTFGLNIGPLLAGAGIVGVAFGFGAQDLVKDIISGMFLLAEDQYGVGDSVNLGEASGVVEGITLRTTRVRDVTGTLWYIRNGEIRRVGNMSQQWSRAIVDIAIAYGSDIDKAAEVIKRVADDMASEDDWKPLILEPPEIWGVEALGADGVTLRLVIKTRPGEQWALARELRRRIKHALEEASIEIPFPQRVVWLRRDADYTRTDPSHHDHSAPSAATGKAAPEEGAFATADDQS